MTLREARTPRDRTEGGEWAEHLAMIGVKQSLDMSTPRWRPAGTDSGAAQRAGTDYSAVYSGQVKRDEQWALHYGLVQSEG